MRNVLSLPVPALLAVCLSTGQLRLPRAPVVWLVSLIFSLILSVGAVVLFQQGTFLIGGQRAAILSTFEPITSLVVGFLVFHENISFRLLAGAALVIAATVIIAVFDMLELKKKRCNT
ncbi:MAG: DMT family transporter [Schaedlerella sp.]